MLNVAEFHEYVASLGITFFTGVPDSLLKAFSAYAEKNINDEFHVITANEGNAVGLSIGHHLATGGIPLVYLQNSGVGNIINPVLSLADQEVYSIPIVFLVGWRGKPGEKDEPQHTKNFGRHERSVIRKWTLLADLLQPHWPRRLESNG